MCAAIHRRPVVHINGNTMDNRDENLRPARVGEVVTSRGLHFVTNERGQIAQDVIVRSMYKHRARSVADTIRWNAYCARATAAVAMAKRKLPIWVLDHLRRWLDNPADPLSGSTFKEIVAYMTKGETSMHLSTSLSDFSFTLEELKGKTPQDIAREVIARGELTADEMLAMEPF